MARLPLWSLVALLGACGPSPTEPQVAPVATAPAASLTASAASSAPTPPPAPAPARVPVRATDARWGSDQAPVTAVVFGRLGLNGHERVAAQLDELQRTHGPDKLRIVWKGAFQQEQMPGFKQAQIVAGIASVGGGETVRKFLALAREQPGATFRIETLMGLAREAGVADVPTLEKRVVADEFAPVVREDGALAERLGVTSLGAVFINGYRLTGRIKKNALATVVADELRATEALVASGTPLAEAYVRRTQANASQSQEFPERRPELDIAKRYRVSLGTSPAQGDARAPVTLVVFSSYQEPFTRRTQPVLKALQKRYGADLRIVWKNAPLAEIHRFAEPLALATLQLRIDSGDAAFWRAHEKLLDERSWKFYTAEMSNDRAQDPVVLARLRSEAGIRKGKEPSEATRSLLAADKAQAHALNLLGRPVFFINGRPLTGGQPEEKFRTLIDAELAAAREQIKAGVKPAQVYEALMTPLPEPTDDD